MSESFKGFPRATVAFLKKLKANNNRDWFNANKHGYETDVVQPALQFIETMQGPLKKVSGCFTAAPSRTGGSLMRIYRDTRFSADKTPYKTNMGIHFRHVSGKDVHAPGFYFHIDPAEVFFGSGIWKPDGASLRKIRIQIVDQSDRWKRLSRQKKLMETFEFAGESLKRPPRDFDPNHPLIDDLKRKDFILVAKLKRSELYDERLISNVAGMIRGSSGLIQFLCEALHLPF